MAEEKPVICYQNILNMTGTTVTGYPTNTTLGYLSDYSSLKGKYLATSTSPEDIRITAASSVEVNTLIIYGHNLDGKTIQLWKYTTPWSVGTSVLSFVQSGNGNIYKTITKQASTYWLITQNGGSPAASIGEVYLGLRTELPANPVIPFDIGAEIDKSLLYRSKNSFKNHLDRYKLRSFKYVYPPLTEWQDLTNIDFWLDCRANKPFFFNFRPTTTPSDVLLMRNTNQHFNANFNGRLVTGREFNLEEAL